MRPPLDCAALPYKSDSVRVQYVSKHRPLIHPRAKFLGGDPILDSIEERRRDPRRVVTRAIENPIRLLGMTLNRS